MDPVDLILTVCLVAAPEICREERLHFEDRGPLLKCMFLAPAEIARWSKTRPKYRVVRWQCAYPGKEIEL